MKRYKRLFRRSFLKMPQFHVDPYAFLAAAILLLLLPLKWFAAVLAAAMIHELFHIAAVELLGGQVHSVEIGVGGAVITAELKSHFLEILCSAAGPIGSFTAFFLFRAYPQFALSAFLQGVFNLLPIYPLDGGRILYCIMEILGAKQIERVQIILNVIIVTLVFVFSLYLTAERGAGLLPVAMALILSLKTFSRKRPCKREENRIQ